MVSNKRSRTVSTELTSGNAWMLTFADLLSLLLTFFVLVFSMNTVKFDNWAAVVRTMSDEFNPNRPAVSPTKHETPTSVMQVKAKGLKLAYMREVLARNMQQIPLFQSAHVYLVNDQVVISIPASVLFDRKRATPTGDAVEALRALTGVLIQVRNKIQVAGHTDQAPVANQLFRSNWELSLTRARVIAGIIADAGYRQNMAVLGFADTRFHQLDGSLTQERRYDLAERIDIIILDERQDRNAYELF